MGITKTYTCDKCDHSQRESTQMQFVGVHINSINLRPSISSLARIEKLWCRKCVEAFGFLPAPKDKKNEHVITPPPTFEDIVRRIIDEELAEM